MSNNQYSEEKFFSKIRKACLKAGRDVIEKALWLFYVLQKPEVPFHAKQIVVSALAYFICPIDLIPDALLPLGYTDDLTVLSGALLTVAMHIDQSVKMQTQQKLADWFD